MQSIGQSHASRQRLPHGAPQRFRGPALEQGEEEQLRRLYGDRMRIQKTRAIPQPQWGMIGAILLTIALSLGLGLGLGGGLVAVGIGLGWLSVALCAMIWRELELAYQLFMSRR